MDREHLILREIVEMHIDSGEAVGSKSVAVRLGNQLSSASIRAVMATLGERGFIIQPHTSAGRVPTDRGYREYLTGLGPSLVRPRDKARVEALAWHDGESATAVMREAASTVAGELGTASVVVVPKLERSLLQSLAFVWLGAGRVLAVAVTAAGVVHERMLRVDPAITRGDLERFTNYLDTLLPGRALGEVRRVIEAAQREDRAAEERAALALGRRALEGVEGEAEVLIDGASRVLASREFSEAPERAAELVKALEQREVWLGLLDLIAEADDTVVYVGAELGATGINGLESCGLVIRRYRANGTGGGLVALVGPKRIDYRRAIPLLALAARRLGDVLAAG